MDFCTFGYSNVLTNAGTDHDDYLHGEAQARPL